MRNVFLFGAAWSLGLGLAMGCGDSGDGDGNGSPSGTGAGGPENTGATCEAPADCYPGITQTDLDGEVMCLDRVRGGYCTHTCEADDACCAVDGVCKDGIAEVCSPFESTGDKMCFLSCEEGDLVPAMGQSGPVDEQEYCQREAGREFICRSSGGGSENRKVCVPGDCGVGAVCDGDAACASGLVCLTTFTGGYCGKKDCALDTDCPADSRCVEDGGATYCYRTCAGDTDCSFCRGSDVFAACRDDVAFAEAGTPGSVCVPPGL
ncbi:MAG: hypothetical protein WKG00_12870 [Polyangiaceae bacterium]